MSKSLFFAFSEYLPRAFGGPGMVPAAGDKTVDKIGRGRH